MTAPEAAPEAAHCTDPDALDYIADDVARWLLAGRLVEGDEAA